MGTGRHKLTATAIKAAAPGTYQDGAGLMLLKATGSGSWVWRYMAQGRRRDMGLGRWPDLSLAEARKARDQWAAVLATGADPIAERDRQREEERAAQAKVELTLAEAVDAVFAKIKATLREDGERGRWRSPLDTHVLPRLGGRRLSSLGAADLRDCLAGIWETKHPTAEKAIQRLGIVFRKGQRMDLPCDPLTVDKAREMLGAVIHVATPITAVPWQRVPEVFARLDNGGPSHLCLRFLILTAVRSTPARGARFEEVEGDVWTVPAARMKGTQSRATDFRVPLSPAALSVLEEAREYVPGPLFFPGTTGAPVSTTSLEQALKRLGEEGQPHGFRSSFKDWTRETGAVSWEIAETSLAHKIGGTVERSYQRSDLLEPRREAMRKWAEFVTGEKQ